MEKITEKQFISYLSHNPDEKTLAEKIIVHCEGWENFFYNWETYANSIISGTPFFTYSKDTCKFFDENREEILCYLVNLCYEMGEDFHYFFPKNANKSDFFLWIMGIGEDSQITEAKNWLVWVTVENIARQVEYCIEETES